MQQFLADSSCIDYPISYNGYQHVFSDEFQENCHPTVLASFTAMEESQELTTEPVEIFEQNILHINTGLTAEQRHQLMSMIHKKYEAFSWDYLDRRGIHSNTYIHHIYTNEEMKPVW